MTSPSLGTCVLNVPNALDIFSYALSQRSLETRVLKCFFKAIWTFDSVHHLSFIKTLHDLCRINYIVLFWCYLCCSRHLHFYNMMFYQQMEVVSTMCQKLKEDLLSPGKIPQF